jgi:hypothetical protein
MILREATPLPRFAIPTAAAVQEQCRRQLGCGCRLSLQLPLLEIQECIVDADPKCDILTHAVAPGPGLGATMTPHPWIGNLYKTHLLLIFLLQ